MNRDQFKGQWTRVSMDQHVGRSLRLARRFIGFGKCQFLMKVGDWLNRLLRSPSGFDGKTMTALWSATVLTHSRMKGETP